MADTRVYDLPTRAFHRLFAAFFVTAYAIANLVDDESLRFPLHMLAGMGMVFVVVLRLLWSAVGTIRRRPESPPRGRARRRFATLEAGSPSPSPCPRPRSPPANA